MQCAAPRADPLFVAGNPGRLALRLRNIDRAALLGGRQRLHASDEIFVAKEDLLTQTGLPQRRFAFVCVSHQCGVLLRRTRAVTLSRYRAAQQIAVLRISVIVDARFSLIVDGETASSRVRRGGAQVPVVNVAQASTISLKRPRARGLSGLGLGFT